MLIPVILSGGSGTRLWPVSREANPKPFMTVGDGGTLLAKTYARASALAGVPEVVTVTNRDYLFKTRDEYAAGKNAPPSAFILEPFGRNTAPAIALALRYVADRHGEDAVMLVLAADHLIQNQDAFAADCRLAESLANEGLLVTFGIKPDKPDTGFGYIEIGDELPSKGAFRASRFVEKPYLELAQKYLDAGNYLWNSGMFCFRVRDMREALRKFQPELLEATDACWKASVAMAQLDDQLVEIESASFKGLPDISIDYAVMEKAPNVAVVKAGFDWSDIGSWNAIHGAVRGDEQGNRVVGEAVLVDVKNTFIQSEGRMVAAIGVQNLVIVDTPDALLVADRDRTQDVKKVVEQLKGMQHETVKLHRTVSRPWGTYTVLEEGEGFKIKRIIVKPGHSISLQLHHHRSEHWVVVGGTAKVQRGEDSLMLRENESTFIPAGTKHRLQNPGLLDLVIIEVQSGEYLGEDDIVRFTDAYGRK